MKAKRSRRRCVVWRERPALQTCLSAEPCEIYLLRQLSICSWHRTWARAEQLSCLARSDSQQPVCKRNAWRSCRMLETTSFLATSGTGHLAGPTSVSSRRTDGLPNEITHWQDDYFCSPSRDAFLHARFSKDWRVVSGDPNYAAVVLHDPKHGSYKSRIFKTFSCTLYNLLHRTHKVHPEHPETSCFLKDHMTQDCTAPC